MRRCITLHNTGTAEQHTNAYIKVMDNPKVCVLGHTESADYPYDYDAVTKACKEKERCNGVQRQPFQKPDLYTASA